MNLNEDKFAFGLLALVLVVAAWFLIFKFPAIGSNFPTLVAGITGIYTIFAGAHVARSWVDSKTPDDAPPPPAPAPPPPPQELVAPPPVVLVPPHPSLVPAEIPLLPALPPVPKSLAEIAKSLEKMAEKKRKKRS